MSSVNYYTVYRCAGYGACLSSAHQLTHELHTDMDPLSIRSIDRDVLQVLDKDPLTTVPKPRFGGGGRLERGSARARKEDVKGRELGGREGGVCIGGTCLLTSLTL